MKRLRLLMLLPLSALLLGGCATKALWEEGRFARYHEPATPPNLGLFLAHPKETVLVQYDETREGDEAIQPRSYWLDEYSASTKNPCQPKFISAPARHGLTPIPVFASATNLPSLTIGFYAVVATNGQDFALYSGEKKLGAYELPVYQDASGRTKQVLLTPLAVVADLTIVGGVLAVWLLPAWWGSLNDITH